MEIIITYELRLNDFDFRLKNNGHHRKPGYKCCDVTTISEGQCPFLE